MDLAGYSIETLAVSQVGPPGFEPGTTSVLGYPNGVLTPGWHPTKLDYGPLYDLAVRLIS